MQNLNVSAGDLLSRTHEELVLLLIQLRRQNATTARTIEQCCTEIHEVQVCCDFCFGLGLVGSLVTVLRLWFPFRRCIKFLVYLYYFLLVLFLP